MSAYAGAAPPTVLTSVPLNSKMVNVTAFVDVTNIAQYTQKQVRCLSFLVTMISLHEIALHIVRLPSFQCNFLDLCLLRVHFRNSLRATTCCSHQLRPCHGFNSCMVLLWAGCMGTSLLRPWVGMGRS